MRYPQLMCHPQLMPHFDIDSPVMMPALMHAMDWVYLQAHHCHAALFADMDMLVAASGACNKDLQGAQIC